MRKLLFDALAICLLSVPGFCAAPSIAAQGVKNAASFADPRLPNGSIAQGSIFNVFGSNMGPTSIAYASSLPLPTTLSGTTVSVTVGGNTVQCFMFYTSAGQVAAILPSTTALGTGTITVSYNGTASPTAPITVVKSSFGIFTVNQQGSGTAVILDGNNNVSSNSFAFQPGETVVAWGTGLGPISGSDATTPPSGNLPGITVAVTVGGQSATVAYAGRSGYAGEDQIDFVIPSGISGCAVPVAISVTNGNQVTVSNWVTMAIGATPTCTSTTTAYPPGFQQALGSGSVRVGSVLLNHSVTTTLIPSFTGGSPTTINTVGDQGEAGFDIFPASDYTNNGYDLPYGACAIINSVPILGVQPKGLDAGPAINVSGAGGAKQITETTNVTGAYYTVLGGGTPLPGQTAQPLYFSPGTYAVNNGSGGKDVGGFNVNITVPPAFTWTNYSAITSVPRSQPLTVNWTGGDPSWDVYLIGSSSVTAAVSVSFECRAHVSDQTLTVPVSILQALPPSATLSGLPLGALTMTTQSATIQFGSVTGLDLFTYGYSIEYQNGSVPFQ